jgi:hypothetical protein
MRVYIVNWSVIHRQYLCNCLLYTHNLLVGWNKCPIGPRDQPQSHFHLGTPYGKDSKLSSSKSQLSAAILTDHPLARIFSFLILRYCNVTERDSSYIYQFNVKSVQVSPQVTEELQSKEANVYLPSLRMKVPDHVYVLGHSYTCHTLMKYNRYA